MDVIEILSDDDDAPAPVRAEIDEEEDSQEVCFLSTTPAPFIRPKIWSLRSVPGEYATRYSFIFIELRRRGPRCA